MSNSSQKNAETGRSLGKDGHVAPVADNTAIDSPWKPRVPGHSSANGSCDGCKTDTSVATDPLNNSGPTPSTNDIPSCSDDRFEDKDYDDYLDKRADRAQTDHKMTVYGLREKFSWFALIIVMVWLGSLMLGFLFHATHHFMPRLLFAFAVSTSFILLIVFPLYCRRASRAQKKYISAEKNAEVTKDRQSRKEYRAEALAAKHECKRSMYLAVKLSSIIGVVSFWSALLFTHFYHFLKPFEWHLDNKMLTVAATSTTVSILGILGAVMFWLFPRDKAPEAKKDDKSTQEK